MRGILAVAAVGFVLVVGGAAGADSGGATVSISNQSYAPIVAGIQPGGTVTWVNDDEETHSVFIDAVGADHLVAPGATYSYTFGDVGEFTYHCTLHSHAGKVVVAAAVTTSAPPPPKPAPTTVATTLAPTTVATTLAPTTVATTASTSSAVASSIAVSSTAVQQTTMVTHPSTVLGADSTVAPLGTVDGAGGGGLPSAALIGGGGAGAALGVAAGFLIRRRMDKRVASGA